jgi:hypothetical protein
VIRFINLKLQQALTLTEDPSLQLLLNNGQVSLTVEITTCNSSQVSAKPCL